MPEEVEGATTVAAPLTSSETLAEAIVARDKSEGQAGVSSEAETVTDDVTKGEVTPEQGAVTDTSVPSLDNLDPQARAVAEAAIKQMQAGFTPKLEEAAAIRRENERLREIERVYNNTLANPDFLKSLQPDAPPAAGQLPEDLSEMSGEQLQTILAQQILSGIQQAVTPLYEQNTQRALASELESLSKPDRYGEISPDELARMSTIMEKGPTTEEILIAVRGKKAVDDLSAKGRADAIKSLERTSAAQIEGRAAAQPVKQAKPTSTLDALSQAEQEVGQTLESLSPFG